MHAYFALMLLIPPPVPPPPPELLEAAREVRRNAPLAAAWREQAIASAVAKAADAVLDTVGRRRDFYEMAPYAQQAIGRLVASRAGEVETWADRCQNENVGRRYDLETLKDMARVVRSPGGRALWDAAAADMIQSCYNEAVLEVTIDSGLRAAISWLYDKGLLGKVPPYDPKKADLAVFAAALESLCGTGARGAVLTKDGQLGIGYPWLQNDSNHGTGYASFCLLSAARAAGYDLRVFYAGGSG